MGFTSGRVTCMRFRVDGKAPRSFDNEFLELLAANAIGKQRIAAGDGSQAGWIAGDHILDTSFDLAKNVVNDSLHIAMRVDEIKMPSDLLRAYYQVELQALTATNPSGFPSSKQKRQAREYAKDRLETEAKDGRFLRRKAIPILWDAPSNELLVAPVSGELAAVSVYEPAELSVRSLKVARPFTAVFTATPKTRKMRALVRPGPICYIARRLDAVPFGRRPLQCGHGGIGRRTSLRC